MKRGRRRNPSMLATAGWATVAASITGVGTYYVLREVFVRQVVNHCLAEIQEIGEQMQGVSVTPTPRSLIEARIREFFQ